MDRKNKGTLGERQNSGSPCHFKRKEKKRKEKEKKKRKEKEK